MSELLHTRPNGAPPLHLYNNVSARLLGPVKPSHGKKRGIGDAYQVSQRDNEDWIDEPRQTSKANEEYYLNQYHDPTTSSPRVLDPVAKEKKKARKLKASNDLPSKNNPLVLQSFLKNFLGEDLASFKDCIDLGKHREDSGSEVTDATLQEIAELHPGVAGIIANNCPELSDIGLWAIARTCHQLRQLSMANCNKVTQVGLRSLSLRCQLLQEVNFSGCAGINDYGVKVLAVSCPDLRKVNFSQCGLLTDVSIAELARCCPLMTHVNVAWCTKLSEFGDKALVEYGKNCPLMKVVDLTGCEYVQDAGIRALARGCKQLEELSLSGCVDLTGVSLRAICKGENGVLKTLRLAKCVKIKNNDIWELSEFVRNLVYLDISSIKKITLQGIRGLCEWSTGLQELRLNSLTKLNDESLLLLANSLTVLRTLHISGNNNFTLGGVKSLCNGCTILTTVELKKCKRITRQGLGELASLLPFVQLAPDRVALIPMDGAEELIRETEQYRLETAAAILIQKMFRGVKARGGVTLLRYHALKRYIVPKFQGLVRGHLCRQKLRAQKELARRIQAAIVIQCGFRTYKGRKIIQLMKAKKRHQLYRVACSIKIQSTFRGWVSRVYVASIRRKLALQAMMRFESRQREEQMALRIQRTWRAHHGYSIYLNMYREKIAKEEHEKKLLESAIMVQCMYRNRKARMERYHLLEAQAEARRMDKAARMLQRAYRGHHDRSLYNAMLLRQQWLMEEKAAMLLQKCWRGYKGRHLTAVYRSILSLKNREVGAVTVIQAWWRTYQGKQLIEFLRLAKLRKQMEQDAALNIERVFRGHKGRENAEVAKALLQLRIETAKMRTRQTELEKQKAELDSQLSRKQKWLDRTAEKLVQMKTEHTEVLKHRAKWYDSANISGTMQRYQTSYLVTALQMLMEELRAKEIQELKVAEDLNVEIRTIDKELRVIIKELVPLEQKLERDTRSLRASRLYSKVRRKRASAVNIQRLFRGHRTRSAIRGGAFYWIECYDENTGEMYYYNTWTQQSSYERPKDLIVLMDHPAEPTASGWIKATDDASGHEYYYNTKTDEYRWEKPDDFDEETGTKAKTVSEYFNGEDMAQVTSRATSRRKGKSWVEYETEDGENVYYYNQHTGETTWDKPEDFDQGWLDENRVQLTSRSIATRDINAEWQELLDPESGATFYYNSISGETRWSLPPSSFNDNEETQYNVEQSYEEQQYSLNTYKENESYNQHNLEYDESEATVHLPKDFLEEAAKNPVGTAIAAQAGFSDPRWIEYVDDHGEVYHTFTGNGEKEAVGSEQQIKRGEVDLESLVPVSLSLGIVGDGWEEMLEPKSCTTFYYNAESGKVAWDPPIISGSNYTKISATKENGDEGDDLNALEQGEEKEYIDTSMMEFSDVLEVFEANLNFNPVLQSKIERIVSLMDNLKLKLRVRASDLDELSEEITLKLREQFEWLTDAIQDGSLLTAETITDKIVTVLLKQDKFYKATGSVPVR